MTELLKKTIICPRCSETGEAEIWATVNANTDPDAAQWLIDGFLFDWECPACGASATVNHDCLYHDPARKLMIQYATNAEKATEAAAALKTMRDDGYEVRIAGSRESLREKAAIARDGLDDRAIEIVKFLLFNKFVGEGKIGGDARAYYGALDEDGSVIVEFVGSGEPLESSVPRDVYDAACERIPHVGEELLASFSIDRPWAAKALDKLH